MAQEREVFRVRVRKPVVQGVKQTEERLRL